MKTERKKRNENNELGQEEEEMEGWEAAGTTMTEPFEPTSS
jgi:hypothetical protein